MLKAAFLIVSTSYFAWYFQQYETATLYPFDETYETPQAAGESRLRETLFTTDDGADLIVWRAEAAPGRPTVLYLPGNAGGLKDRADRFRRLIDQGFGVIAPAYRGSSGSTGMPDEVALIADAAAVAKAHSGILVLYGESLGAAIAIRLAASDVGERVVLEAPFTSVPALVAAQYPNEELDHLITQRWNSLDAAPDMKQPLLVIHGADDKIVPPEMGRNIFAAAGSPDKTMLEVENLGHAGLWTVEVQSRLYTFMTD